MAASNVASALPACVNSAISPVDSGVPLKPSVWGEFFANYSNPISKVYHADISIHMGM
jgi:hypothetical protein